MRLVERRPGSQVHWLLGLTSSIPVPIQTTCSSSNLLQPSACKASLEEICPMLVAVCKFLSSFCQLTRMGHVMDILHGCTDHCGTHRNFCLWFSIAVMEHQGTLWNKGLCELHNYMSCSQSISKESRKLEAEIKAEAM